jgi:hypothetical protein
MSILDAIAVAIEDAELVPGANGWMGEARAAGLLVASAARIAHEDDCTGHNPAEGIWCRMCTLIAELEGTAAP